jgi:hypothetical protein
VPIPRAVVDADVLYRRHPRNLLVWHALAGMFELHWSKQILAETRRNLIERNRSRFGERRAGAVDRTLGRLTEALRVAGAGDCVQRRTVALHEPAMPNHPKDRHVLAAAIAAGAQRVITTNIKDFAAADTRPLGVLAQTPDAFLTSLLGHATIDVALDALGRQAHFHGWSIAQLLALLADEGRIQPALAPRYVRHITQLSGIEPAGKLSQPRVDFATRRSSSE